MALGKWEVHMSSMLKEARCGIITCVHISAGRYVDISILIVIYRFITHSSPLLRRDKCI